MLCKQGGDRPSAPGRLSPVAAAERKTATLVTPVIDSPRRSLTRTDAQLASS